MAENNGLVQPEPPLDRSPFSLQSLCRLVLMPFIRISRNAYGGFTFTEDDIKLLGHASRLNCLKSIETVMITL